MFEVLQFTCTKYIETHLKHKCTFSSAHKHSGKKKKKKNNFKSIYFYFSFAVAVQLLSRVQLFATTWTAACQTSLFFTVFWSLLKLMSTESIMPSSHLILCCSFSSCLQSFPASGSFPVSWALCIRWPKYWSVSFNITPSNEYSWMISFSTDRFDVLAVQGTLTSHL